VAWWVEYLTMAIGPNQSDAAGGATGGGGGGNAGIGAQLVASRPDLQSKVSDAQRIVLELLLEGMTEPQIAERIGRSRHTVHDHTKAIYAALGVSTRVHLVLLFSQPRR
jgi:DNA-binding NarL/FixJ family response regulator